MAALFLSPALADLLYTALASQCAMTVTRKDRRAHVEREPIRQTSIRKRLSTHAGNNQTVEAVQ